MTDIVCSAAKKCLTNNTLIKIDIFTALNYTKLTPLVSAITGLYEIKLACIKSGMTAMEMSLPGVIDTINSYIIIKSLLL